MDARCSSTTTAISSPKTPGRAQLLALLGHLWCPDSLAALEEAARAHHQPDLRLAAVKVLSQQSGHRVLRILRDVARSDGNNEVRHLAVQALIWQESRFQIGARSPVGAFGLTQIMPGTAGDLGIYPAYYDDPYLQVTGGARYLAQMLNMFDGNIIHALAAYNAGPGNVQDYGGVPPFAETQHYVVVIPQQYNSYLAAVGGIDALGTIDPVLLANASFSLSAHGAGVYGDYSLVSVRAAALRVQDIITRIGETEDLHEAIALNTYARAELVRLVAARIRLQAARTRVLSAEELAQASARMAEGAFMDFTIREIE